MNEWNDLFFLNEADDEEEKKKNKEEDKDDKKSEKKEKEDESSDDYNDLMSDDDTETSEDDEDSTDDIDSEEDEYNDLMSDDDDTETSEDDGGEYNTLVVVKSDDNDSDGSLYEKAAKTAYAYVVIANNMKHIHLNACGDKFQEIHNFCDELYHHFSYVSDGFFELAAESPLVTLDNPTRAKEHCEDISVETEKEYKFKDALEVMRSNIESAIKYLGELRTAADGIRTDVQSKVDNELEYLNKHSRYFIRKRLSGLDDGMSDMNETYNYYNDLI